MGTFLQDLRHGARHLISQPLVSAAAIGSLALGIGLNVTLFSVVNAVLLRGTPMHEPDRLVEIYSGLSQDFPQLTTSYPDFLDIERGADALAGVAGNSLRARHHGSTAARLARDRRNGHRQLLRPARYSARARARVSAPTRTSCPAPSPVIVVSHGLWQRAFGGAPNVIGQTVEALRTRLHHHRRGHARVHAGRCPAFRPSSGCR